MNFLDDLALSLTLSDISKNKVSDFRLWSFHVLVQLYLPPEYMLNKDFLKEVFIDEKNLLKLDQVKRINVPLYDELAVVKLWPMMQTDE